MSGTDERPVPRGSDETDGPTAATAATAAEGTEGAGDGPSDGALAPADPTASRRRGRIAAVAAGTVGVVLVLFVVLLATREPASNRRVDSPLLGRTAPVVEATTVDGEPFSSTTYAGRWLLVNFFATWCGPCVREHPELIAFQQAHREAGDADVVSVVFDDDPEQVRAWFEENGGDWAVVDAGDSAITEWGVVGVPESYLVDPDGTVVYKLVGGVTAEGLDTVLAQAQAERDAQLAATRDEGP